MAESTRPKRRWRWLLGLSLALNLVFLGLVAGAAYRFAGGPGTSGSAGMRSYATPYLMALPREARRDLHRQVRGDEGSPLPTRAVRRALYDDVLRALRVEPFEPAVVRATLQKQGDTARQVQEVAHAAWLAQVTAMSAQDRAAYADRLEEVLTRGPKGKRPKRSE